jgi:phage protein D
MPAISYTLLIDGAPAASDLLAAIQQIEVEEHADLAAMLRLRLAVGVREDGSGWEIVDDDTFSRLARLSLLVTVGSGMPEPLIEAYVIETRLSASNRPGESTFEVVAMDGTVLMSLEEKVRPWPNMADSDIASVILSEYGLLPDVESTSPTRQELDLTVIQRGTDIQFLRHLAGRNGYECYVELNRLTTLAEGHFHPPRLDGTPQGTLTVNMGSATNVNRLTVRFDTIKPAVADVADLEAGSQSDQTASISSMSLTELGSSSLLGGSQQRRVRIGPSSLFETGELQTYAQAVVDQSAWAITAEGDLDTTAYGSVLRARRPVLVRGVGQRFSGTYYVERVQHLLGGDSYSQHFSLRRNATGLQGTEAFGST